MQKSLAVHSLKAKAKGRGRGEMIRTIILIYPTQKFIPIFKSIYYNTRTTLCQEWRDNINHYVNPS
jgi:hypothetical protein